MVTAFCLCWLLLAHHVIVDCLSCCYSNASFGFLAVLMFPLLHLTVQASFFNKGERHGSVDNPSSERVKASNFCFGGNDILCLYVYIYMHIYIYMDML